MVISAMTRISSRRKPRTRPCSLIAQAERAFFVLAWSRDTQCDGFCEWCGRRIESGRILIGSCEADRMMSPGCRCPESLQARLNS